MIDVQNIKAGKYELVSEVWEEPLSKPGEPHNFRRYVKGDLVQLDEAEARRLYAAGAVVKPGEREQAAVDAAKAAHAAAVAALPVELREELGVDDSALPRGQQSVAPGLPADQVKAEKAAAAAAAKAASERAAVEKAAAADRAAADAAAKTGGAPPVS